MAKRKSIGRDPLDWIGENGPTSGNSPGNGQGQGRGAGSDGPTSGDNGLRGAAAPDRFEESASFAGANGRDPSPCLTLAAANGAGQSTPYPLDRQLLLVDNYLREGTARPRFNQLLWSLLLILTFLGMGIVLFRETRRQWEDRVLTLKSDIEQTRREKGRLEGILGQVIDEKEMVIREKQDTIAKIETLHRGAVEELHVARAESGRLRNENQSLLQRLFQRQESPIRDAIRDDGKPGGAEGAAAGSAAGNSGEDSAPVQTFQNPGKKSSSP